MDVVERLTALAGSPELPLLPPADADQVDEVEGRQHATVVVPSELHRLLAVTIGARLPGLLDLDLTGERHDVEATELLPSGLPVATDGSGNFWLLDLTPDTTESAPVFFLSHDPPVLLYQSPDLTTFVGDVLDDARAVADRAHELVMVVHGARPGAMAYETALAGDQALREFAHYLGEEWTIVDLRQRIIGDGVVWGRYGPRTQLARHGWERVFGYAPYVKARRRPRMAFVLPRRGSPLR